MRCPNCSHEAKEGAKFCPMCGFYLGESPTPPHQTVPTKQSAPIRIAPQPNQEKKKNGKAFLFIIPLIVVVAAAVLFFALKPDISSNDARQALDLLNSEEIADIKKDSKQNRQTVEKYFDKLENEKKLQKYTKNDNGIFFEYKGVKTGYVFDPNFAENNLIAVSPEDAKKTSDDDVLFLICADEGKDYYKTLAEKYKSKSSGKVTVVEDAGTEDFVREINSDYDNIFICTHGTYWNDEYGVFCLSETATPELIAKYANKKNSSIVVYRKIGSDEAFIGLTPDFFENECSGMTCSTIYSSACHSFDNDIMPQKIVSAGAGSFAGYDGKVSVQYDENVAGVFSDSLIGGKTAKQAYNKATSQCGKRSGLASFCFYEKPQESQQNNTATDDSEKQTESEIQTAEIKWVKEPFLEADYVSALFYCSGAGYSDDPLYAYRKSTSSGKEYGVVDLEGNNLISGKNGAYFDCIGNVVTDHVGHSYVPSGNGAIDRKYGGFHQYSDYGLEPDSEWFGLYVADAYFDDNSSDPNAVVYGGNIDKAKCGLWCDNEIVVPMEYDGFMKPSDGITALNKNGLWYYFNSNGNCILSGIEPLDNQYAKDAFDESYDTETLEKNVGAYSFSCGLLPIKNSDGKWGYVDANGDDATEYEFEDATPFKNGRAWAKKDGKWGIIEIEEMANAYEQYEKIINDAYDKLEK
ncbi:MAG: WG repeat-containing protein, partial [Acutalibacteraceae bacterium]